MAGHDLEAPQEGRITCGGVGVSRTEFRANVDRTAGGLRDLGVREGGRVALLLRNSVEFLEISAAAGKRGAYAVPINWHLRSGEIELLLDDSAPSVIFAHADLLDLLPAPWRSRAAIVAVGPAPKAGAAPAAGSDEIPSYATWRAAQAPDLDPPRPAPGSMIYTSGTTGRPKGVERAPASPEQQRLLGAMRRRLYRMTSSSRAAVPGPLYHALPNQFAVHAANEAAFVEIMPRFDAEVLLELIARERITSVALAPIMFVRLLRLPQAVRDAYDISSLEWALHAGGPISPDVKREMIAWWGPIIGEYYGGTETGPLTLCDSLEWQAHPGTCGRPLPEAEVRIVGADGAEAPTGVPGEVYGRLTCYPDFTYRGDPEKRASVGLGDLVSLGDVGYLDDGGFLHLCDRARDMIISGGVNVYPAEVEAALFGCAGVDDCAVFGAPDDEFGERVVAFLVGDGLDPEAIRRDVRARIAAYKAPRQVVVVASLERDSSGKLRKAALRERYLSWAGGAPVEPCEAQGSGDGADG